MNKPLPEPSPKRAYLVTGASLAVVALVGLGITLGRHQIDSGEKAAVATPAPTASPSPTIEASPSAQVSPTATPQATPTPTATATPVSAVLPDSVTSRVTDFYAAYKAKDRVKLATFFSADTTAELKSLHSRLFTGLDTDGNPGGPTLFSTNSAIESVASYKVTSSVAQGTGWKLMVTEQRLNGSGQSAGSVNTIIILVPSGSTWNIDSYAHTSSTGKYDGFLI